MKLIDFQDPRPIYEQITERYKLLILKGVVLPGEQMPSVRKLAIELSANPNTVQRAYSELERQGFIYTVKGRGSFVSGDISLREQRRAELAGRLAALFAEAREIGIEPEELLEEVRLEPKAGGSRSVVKAEGSPLGLKAEGFRLDLKVEESQEGGCDD